MSINETRNARVRRAQALAKQLKARGLLPNLSTVLRRQIRARPTRPVVSLKT